MGTPCPVLCHLSVPIYYSELIVVIVKNLTENSKSCQIAQQKTYPFRKSFTLPPILAQLYSEAS